MNAWLKRCRVTSVALYRPDNKDITKPMTQHKLNNLNNAKDASCNNLMLPDTYVRIGLPCTWM